MFHKKLFVWLILLSTTVAWAHDPFEGTTTIRLRADSIDVDVTLNGRTAATMTGDVDLQNREIPADEFDHYATTLQTSGAKLFGVSAGDQKLAAFQTNVFAGKEGDVEYRLRYPRPAGAARVEANYLLELPAEGYGAMLTVLDMVNNKVVGQKLLRHDDLAFEIPDLSPSPMTNVVAETKPVTATIPQPPPLPVPMPTFSDFFKLGMNHILTGYDHLLFLCGLLVVCRRRGQVVLVITAFTVAHSITLAMAALNLVTISSRIVEPTIAATIVFVGIENLGQRLKPERRWLVAFAFGLVHGFGFASALKEAGLGANGTPFLMPLFSFNLGIETGQLVVAVVFLAVWRVLTLWKPFAQYGKTVVSLAVAIIGAFWFIQRVFF